MHSPHTAAYVITSCRLRDDFRVAYVSALLLLADPLHCRFRCLWAFVKIPGPYS